jgi:hypothetical protein
VESTIIVYVTLTVTGLIVRGRRAQWPAFQTGGTASNSVGGTTLPSLLIDARTSVPARFVAFVRGTQCGGRST